MSVAITCTPAAPVATNDFCSIAVSGVDQNTTTGYDGTVPSASPGSPTQYPASPEVRYYLTFELASVERGRSYVFAPSADGDHVFDNYVFPEAGSWTIRLSNAGDDSSVATQAVTVS